MTNAELIECLRCENENYGDCSLHESDCKYRFGIYCAYRQMMYAAADALEAAEQRIAELEAQIPKEGEWIELDKITTYCSNCNWASYSMLVQKDAFLLRNNKTKFCPNCGAKMQTVTDCHTLEDGER